MSRGRDKKGSMHVEIAQAQTQVMVPQGRYFRCGISQDLCHAQTQGTPGTYEYTYNSQRMEEYSIVPVAYCIIPRSWQPICGR